MIYFHCHCFRKCAVQDSFGVMFNYECYFYFTSTVYTGHRLKGWLRLRAHTCLPTNWKVKAAGSGIQEQLLLHIKFKANLDYRRLRQKTNKTKGNFKQCCTENTC